MTKEELVAQINEATRLIAKNKRLAKEYNAVIRTKGAEKKRLEKELRAMIREENKKPPVEHPRKDCLGTVTGNVPSFGSPCLAFAMHGSDYCWQHRPNK